MSAPYAHVLERYASYMALLGQAPTISGSLPILARPAGSHAPEEIEPSVADGRHDATAAIDRALAEGDVWLTPGRTYLITRTIAVPSHRRILSDGTGTMLVAVGTPGFPEVPYDPQHASSGYVDVLQLHGVQAVELRDFRLMTPITTPAAPQPLLHGIDIRDATGVTVVGLEARGFARAKGIVRVNSASDITIERNLLHGSFTTMLTRQVTGIEVDEAVPRLTAAMDRSIRSGWSLRAILSSDCFLARTCSSIRRCEADLR